ncbi:MAG: hypothetical protein ANABAC_3240 [Anaerolineae bacterium]|jgi:hypothetical protein|nr:MAG: hypothetical protein ANABAC_3240 [Anaerolineae bacterium]
MKAQTVILLIILALLLVGSAALAQSSGLPGYIVQGTSSCDRYHLTGTTWQARGIASGGEYRLAGLTSPTGTGTPCCCSYLPCVLRNY